MQVKFVPMLKYAVVEIAGRQYMVSPGSFLLVNFLGDLKSFECDKILLKVEDDKLELGKPYLKDKLQFMVEPSIVKDRIRVATYKSKANTRRVVGSRPKYNKIQLSSDNREKS